MSFTYNLTVNANVGNPSKITTSSVPFMASYGVPQANGVVMANVGIAQTGIQALELSLAPNKAWWWDSPPAT
ncbi:MAG TPA: hypothetical protein VJQ82_00425 [Terriglobales bacterium]|nr:hypothetical protein [Terriglobales bacterium]